MATFKGGNFNDTLKGGSAADTLWGLAGNDSLFGFGGNDVLDGGTGSDTMRGGAGNDTYYINSTGDKIDEQTNNDSSDKVRSTITVNLNALGAGRIEHATLLGTGNISATGNTKNNSLTGNTGNNSLSGIDGNDTLNGGSGNDKLSGGIGNDRLMGGAGNDTITGGAENDRIDGGAGNDTIRHSGTSVDGDDVLLNFSGGNDTIIFTVADFYDVNWYREGSDLILGAAADGNYMFDGTIRIGGFFYSETNITVKIDTEFFNLDYGTNADLSTIHFTADVANGINNTNDAEVLIGDYDGAGGGYYSGNDVINGNGGYYDALFGLGGDDILNGGAGADNILGGEGWDTLNGGTGDDLLRGDAGLDTFDGGDGFDLLRFNFTPDLDHGVWVDLLINHVWDDGFGNGETVLNVEDVRGSSFDDKLTGDDDGNFLIGDGGNDSLSGGLGDDFLIGSEGNDTLTGGDGADVFRFTSDNGPDAITDFHLDQLDVLDFSFTELAGKDIPTQDLSDYIVLDDSGADTLVFLDVSGAGNPATQIAALTGVHSADGVVVRLDGADFAFNAGEFSVV